MKKVEDFIRQNPGLFDSEEPEPGHLDRFRNRLHAEDLSKSSSIWSVLLKAAAVLIFCALISYTAVHEFRMADERMKDIAVELANPELTEAEQYYTSQLSIYYNRIQKLRFNDDQAEKKQVLDELSAMDVQVKALKHDLKQNPDDERIVHAIINFYQVKIELMDVIIAHAEKNNNNIL